MNKIDRGIIKWRPFESLIPSKQILQNLLLEKKKITKPILSEEEIMNLESQIIEAYYNKEKIQITFYKNGLLKNIKGQIIKIDQVYKLVYLNNNLKLLFNQIIAIKTI